MNFEDCVGQDRALGFLKRALDGGRLSHAYLFLGPAGIGKHRAAEIFSAALSCKEPNSPCGVCDSCRAVEKKEHPDVIHVAPEGKTLRIGAIRVLREQVYERPFFGGKKIFIIEQAHTMNPEAANALLKVLEEPPAYAVFILLSDSDTILDTIRSRCETVRFQALKPRDVEMVLDKKGYTGQSAALAARLCGGNVNTALSILSDEGYFKRRQDYMALCNALSGNSAQKILKDLTALADPGGFLAFAEGYYRDALVYHVTGDAERVAHSDALGHFKTMGEKRAAALLDRVRQARIILAANGNFKLLAAELIREGGLQSWQKS